MKRTDIDARCLGQNRRLDMALVEVTTDKGNARLITHTHCNAVRAIIVTSNAENISDGCYKSPPMYAPDFFVQPKH